MEQKIVKSYETKTHKDSIISLNIVFQLSHLPFLSLLFWYVVEMTSMKYIHIYIYFFPFSFLHVQIFFKRSLLLFLSKYFPIRSMFSKLPLVFLTSLHIYVVNVLKNRQFVINHLDQHFSVNSFHCI
jgi:hypothetical protein